MNVNKLIFEQIVQNDPLSFKAVASLPIENSLNNNDNNIVVDLLEMINDKSFQMLS